MINDSHFLSSRCVQPRAEVSFRKTKIVIAMKEAEEQLHEPEAPTWRGNGSHACAMNPL